MEDSFFRRWARKKADSSQADRPPPAAKPAPRNDDAQETDPAAPASSLPTLKEVALLDENSDFSRFVTPDVGSTVRRAAFKKLFSDPHFNKMDGLDIYISDYTKPSPLPQGMLEALQHAKNLFAPPADEKRDDRDEESLNEDLRKTDGEPGAPENGLQARLDMPADASADSTGPQIRSEPGDTPTDSITSPSRT